MSIFYYKGEDGSFHPLPALVGPPGKDGAVAQIEDESGTKYTSLPVLKFLNCEVTADTEKITVSPNGGQSGSGGGHTIQDSENSNLPQREILKFAEGFQVSDDSETGKTVISYAGTKNVAGYVGEISLFADNQLRENHVWADGSTINPATWPDLAAYAATAGWETDSGTGWYKTPNLQGCFLLPSSSEYAVNTTGGEETHTLTVQEMPAHTHQVTNKGGNVLPGDAWWAMSTTDNSYAPDEFPSGINTGTAGGGQPHNNMPPYYVVTAQIRAKVDEITAKVVEVNSSTLGGFEDGQVLAQQDGKLAGVNITAGSIGAATAEQGALASTAVQPYKAGDTITLGRCCVAAFVSGGGEDLIFTVLLDRPVIATGAAFSGQISVRGSTGQYAVQGYQYSTAQILSISNAGITFTGSPTWTNRPTNNTSLSVDILRATVTLS